MRHENEMELVFESRSVNEGFARVAVAAFMTQLNPTLEEVSDVKTAVSEAVTNAIVHAYDSNKQGRIVMRAQLDLQRLTIEVEDFGCGIPDIDLAMRPFYTSQPEKERSGMGFSLMQSFMDGIQVRSVVGEGTLVTMTKLLEEDKRDVF